jgi:hypothetical protein
MTLQFPPISAGGTWEPVKQPLLPSVSPMPGTEQFLMICEDDAAHKRWEFPFLVLWELSWTPAAKD